MLMNMCFLLEHVHIQYIQRPGVSSTATLEAMDPLQATGNTTKCPVSIPCTRTSVYYVHSYVRKSILNKNSVLCMLQIIVSILIKTITFPLVQGPVTVPLFTTLLNIFSLLFYGNNRSRFEFRAWPKLRRLEIYRHAIGMFWPTSDLDMKISGDVVCSILIAHGKFTVNTKHHHVGDSTR